MKTDILFVDGIGPTWGKWPPAYLSYLFPLAAMLQKNGYSFKVTSMLFFAGRPESDFVDFIKGLNCSAIGLSPHCDNVSHAIRLTNLVKFFFPEIVVVMGGPEVTFRDKEILEKCKCDFIVRGEGDEVIIKLMDLVIRKHGSAHRILGITYRTSSGIVRNPDAPLPDLNSLPTPEYRVLTSKEYWVGQEHLDHDYGNQVFAAIAASHRHIMTSRGCPYQCIFCVEGTTKKGVRFRSLQLALEDLEYFLKVTGVRQFCFADDIFAVSKERLRGFCEGLGRIQKNRGPLFWYAEARANIICENPEMISLMRSVGLRRIQLGVESGSDIVLKNFNKQLTKEQIRRAVSIIAAEKDVHMHLGFILGGPGDTVETIAETKSFLKELIEIARCNLDYQFCYLTPFVGTPIREKPEEHGIRILDKSLDRWSPAFSRVFCVPTGISESELKRQGRNLHKEIMTHYWKTFDQLPESRKEANYVTRVANILIPPSRLTSAWDIRLRRSDELVKYFKMKLRSDSGESIARDNRRKIEYSLVFPLRVASWAYASKAMLISLVSPRGEGFQLNLLESFLWEMASGKNSVEEIFCLAKQQFGDMQLSIEEIFDIYREFEDHYCLILGEIESGETTQPPRGQDSTFSMALKDPSISRKDKVASS